MKNLIIKIRNIGVKPDDPLNISLGKKYYNTILLVSLLLNIFVPLLYLFFVKDLYIIILYSIVNTLIILLTFKLNQCNLFNLSANFSLIAVSINTIFSSYLVFISQPETFWVIFISVKIFFLLLSMIGISLKNSLYLKTNLSIAFTIFLFFAFDYVPFIHRDFLSTQITLKGILYFDFLITIQVTFFTFVSRNFLKVKQYYQTTIENQKNELENSYKLLNSRTKSLTDNINQANKFYNLLLEIPTCLKDYFSKYFIIYKPVMFMSGDFYFFKTQKDKIYIIIADSLGHGISAAIVNIYALALLQFRTKKFSDPASLLYELKKMFDAYKSIPLDVDISFDIAILMYNKSNNVITYSSAALPINVIRNKTLIKLDYHRSPIAQYSHFKNFENKKFTAQKGDKIYIYTDGIMHLMRMVCRENRRPYNFKKLLLKVSNRSFDVQKRYFSLIINSSHKFNIPTDDITLMAFEI